MLHVSTALRACAHAAAGVAVEADPEAELAADVPALPPKGGALTLAAIGEVRRVVVVGAGAVARKLAVREGAMETGGAVEDAAGGTGAVMACKP